MTSQITGFLNNNKHILFFPYICKDNTFCEPLSINLNKGKYLFELWGARSGNDYFGSGYARGGYAAGELTLHESRNFILNIGGVGSDGVERANVKGGNNGGGDGGLYGAGGGGSTDIRLDSTLQSRIIVAAGAGGGERASRGHGGGINGLSGSLVCNTHSLDKASMPGTQTSGGSGGTLSPYGTSISGSFGQGGSGILSNEGGSGGGGGYFGGGGTPYVCDGSGGSSYISGHQDCRSVTGPTSTITNTSTIHYSGLKFNNPITIPGNSNMPLPSLRFIRGIGNDGPGAIRITTLSLCTCKFTRKQVEISYFIAILLATCI